MARKTSISPTLTPMKPRSFDAKAAASAVQRSMSGTLSIAPVYTGAVAASPVYGGAVAAAANYTGAVTISTAT